MHRRDFLRAAAALGALGTWPWSKSHATAPSVDSLPTLQGELSLYLGRGEGGLYEDVLTAIAQRNPDFTLNTRRGPNAALANAIIAESNADVRRADVFWAVDTGAIGVISEAGLAHDLPTALTDQLQPEFRYKNWVPVSGRIRTVPFFTQRLVAKDIPTSIMAIPDSGLRMGWAPAYASCQSFITAMRLLEGENATIDWLQRVKKNAKSYAGELGVVMGVERGEVDIGFANHYYTLRLKAGKPSARVDLAFTHNDAGCLVNASGAQALMAGDLPVNFIRYLLTKEVQSFLAREAYEIPLVSGIAPPPGLPPLAALSPPKVDMMQLADLRPTLNLMRKAGVL
ncbi:MAG: extracellular solute-binding protein [Halioglobus sp.]|nr:extracellular solute-binding protein [Halioglobus sp.]